ncbi:GNAT family N-acetyltransferase [Peribacillus butanolivorans]|uniref:GNAT family N-acetyltransferase n=1 Tax=Peribacillus butanolivorans TaxID=421767 RepID=UPI002E21B8C5|nr:GNAT family N-acetyltransferase [Peribacillus butanolivorans]
MDQSKLIQKIEEISMNALPALQTQIYDGWILRFAAGYTKRANSINPIYFSHEDLQSKIENSEHMYLERNIKVVYKITPQASPSNLDSVLEKFGYSLEGTTSVQVLTLLETEAPSKSNFLIYNQLHENWFRNFCLLNHISDHDQTIFKKMLENIIPDRCFMLLTDDSGTVLACGLGVLEGEYLGVFNIVTQEKFRNQGYGAKLIKNLLHWGKENGAKNAYLQVILSNAPALNLYAKLGFEEKYKYWYRIKN